MFSVILAVRGGLAVLEHTHDPLWPSYRNFHMEKERLQRLADEEAMATAAPTSDSADKRDDKALNGAKTKAPGTNRL